jgi:multiphosphoryl transfer protein
VNEQFTTDIVVASHHGLDAPTAARFVRAASRFDAEITVHYRGAMANAKSIIGLLSLCVRAGDTIRVVASGADAMKAAEALEGVFATPSSEILSVPIRAWPMRGVAARTADERPARL